MKTVVKVSQTLACILLIWLLWFFSIKDFGVDKFEAQSIKEFIIVKILPWIYNYLWVKITITVVLCITMIGLWTNPEKTENIKEISKDLNG
jgi:hypothetical protein